MKYKHLKNFISASESSQIIEIGNYLKPNENLEIENEHIRTINEGTNGFSILCDFSKTEISSSVAKFQGDATNVDTVPHLLHELAFRISEKTGISKDHVFCQYIKIGSNGKVMKHYDAGIPGYVTYKCNICVSGPEKDTLFIDDSEFSLELGDLYCFEANFYKHWVNSSETPRVLLSYGFILPIEELGYKESDSRVRLSNRIWKTFISKHNI